MYTIADLERLTLEISISHRMDVIAVLTGPELEEMAARRQPGELISSGEVPLSLSPAAVVSPWPYGSGERRVFQPVPDAPLTLGVRGALNALPPGEEEGAVASLCAEFVRRASCRSPNIPRPCPANHAGRVCPVSIKRSITDVLPSLPSSVMVDLGSTRCRAICPGRLNSGIYSGNDPGLLSHVEGGRQFFQLQLRHHGHAGSV